MRTSRLMTEPELPGDGLLEPEVTGPRRLVLEVVVLAFWLCRSGLLGSSLTVDIGELVTLLPALAARLEAAPRT